MDKKQPIKAMKKEIHVSKWWNTNWHVPYVSFEKSTNYKVLAIDDAMELTLPVARIYSLQDVDLSDPDIKVCIGFRTGAGSTDAGIIPNRDCFAIDGKFYYRISHSELLASALAPVSCRARVATGLKSQKNGRMVLFLRSMETTEYSRKLLNETMSRIADEVHWVNE